MMRDLIDPGQVAELAGAIAEADAKEFRNQYPAYAADIAGETRKALDALRTGTAYRPYDILRASGVPLGKRDYMGLLRMKSPDEYQAYDRAGTGKQAQAAVNTADMRSYKGGPKGAISPSPVRVKVRVAARAATAILDHLLHHSHVLTIRGDSYPLREKRRSGLLQKNTPMPETVQRGAVLTGGSANQGRLGRLAISASTTASRGGR